MSPDQLQQVKCRFGPGIIHEAFRNDEDSSGLPASGPTKTQKAMQKMRTDSCVSVVDGACKMGAGQNRGISRKHAPVFPQPPVSRMGTQVSVVGALGLRAGGRIPNRVAFPGQQID